MDRPCCFLLLFCNFEFVFADAAQRALEIIRQSFPLCSGFYSVIRISRSFVIYPSAYFAFIFHFNYLLYRSFFFFFLHSTTHDCFQSKKMALDHHYNGAPIILTILSDLVLCCQNILPTRYTIRAQTHAIAHCPSTTKPAHFPPSSLFTEAIAATQGV